MFKYLCEIFCKDTIIGLCQLEKNGKNILFKNNYSKELFSNKYFKESFSQCFTIGQTAYRL